MEIKERFVKRFIRIGTRIIEKLIVVGIVEILHRIGSFTW